VMDYPCAKFGDFSFGRFSFIMGTNRQTDKQTDRQTDRQTGRITNAAKRLTPATIVGVSNDTKIISLNIIY